MYLYQGKTALITGASSGIGATFAYELAARGMDIVLVARSEERLQALATEIVQRHGRKVEVIAADLSDTQGVALVIQEVESRGLTIDLLVNNAGIGTHGYFETIAPERDQQLVMLNVAAVVALSHAFLPAMAARGEGAVINVGSTASFQPVQYMPAYGASKAFVLSFSTALAEEYRHKGVRILALCPGATITSFFETAGEEAAMGSKRTSKQAVTTALRALEQGRSVVVDGFMNMLISHASRILSRSIMARITGNGLRPGHSQKNKKNKKQTTVNMVK
ncbi:dehydrogenase [Ktedonobacteria bacterium brp13]|nr:dehydrogenase [Ktedonobacteria bacterium brp13]